MNPKRNVQSSTHGSSKLRAVRPVLINCFLLLASIAVALGVGEALVRLAAPQQLILIRPDIWRAADSIGWTTQPNVRTTVNTGEGTVAFITDEEGFRVSRTGRIEADTEVLLLGDSFMEALQVEYERSLPGLIETNARAAFGRTVAVRNAAVGGWGPSQYLIRGKQLLGHRHYSAVIVAVYTGNDVVRRRVDYVPPRPPSERASFRLPQDLSRRELIASIAQPLNDFLEVRSHLFVLLKTKLRWLAIRADLSHAYFPTVLYKREASSSRWDVTAQLLADLASVARAKETPIAFVLIPSNVQVKTDELAGYIAALRLDPDEVDADQPSLLLAHRLTSRGLYVVDALDAFRVAQMKGQRLYGNVDEHLSPSGHQLLWTLIRPRLAQAFAGHDFRKNSP